ncbi:MAG: hypothetical protein ACLFQ5_10755, partial [Oceanicaulis sp.]
DVWADRAEPVEARIDVRRTLGERRSGPHLKHGAAPWRLDFDVTHARLSTPGGASWLTAMAAHELYHLMLIETGWRATAPVPQASRVALEEVAASLYGHCANLAAGEPALADAAPAGPVNLPGLAAPASAPFDAREMNAAVQALRRGAAPRAVYFALNRTLFLRLSGGEGRIAPHGPAAEAMLDACRRVGGDPARVLPLLEP